MPYLAVQNVQYKLISPSEICSETYSQLKSGTVLKITFRLNSILRFISLLSYWKSFAITTNWLQYYRLIASMVMNHPSWHILRSKCKAQTDIPTGKMLRGLGSTTNAICSYRYFRSCTPPAVSSVPFTCFNAWPRLRANLLKSYLPLSNYFDTVKEKEIYAMHHSVL